jgi:hypothetical protein
MYASDGWLWRFPPAIQRQVRPEVIKAGEVYTWRLFDSRQDRWDSGTLPRVLIIGDSQAADFINILASANRLTQANVRTLRASKQCQPLLTFRDREFQEMDAADKAECARAFQQLKDPQAFQGVHLAILAFQWDEFGLPHVLRAVSELHHRGIDKVMIVGRKSQGRGGPDLIMDHGLGPGLEAYAAELKNPYSAPANSALRAMHGDFVFLDLMKFICPTEHYCRVLTSDKDVIFFDGSHLSPAGARYFAQALEHAGLMPF